MPAVEEDTNLCDGRNTDDGRLNYEILNVLPFDSTRKRMSIIVRHPNSKQIILYCK
ncbi:unnamed protein product, partial [Callosobruchus maculatus]